jgi:hypothetical protein
MPPFMQCLRLPLPVCLQRMHMPPLHVIGNHCLSAGRTALVSRLQLPASYYSLPLPGSWRLVVLDTTEMSGHSGYPEDHEASVAARHYEAAHPLTDEEPHMVGSGGKGSAGQPLNGSKASLQAAVQHIRAHTTSPGHPCTHSHSDALPGRSGALERGYHAAADGVVQAGADECRGEGRACHRGVSPSSGRG